MPAFVVCEGVLTVEDDDRAASSWGGGESRARENCGGGAKGGVQRESLALRFYGSSSSIMRRKSTIKPLLQRAELPVLNHCVQRALKTRGGRLETFGEMAEAKLILL